MTKIDWTKPLELSDGTPVVLRPGSWGPNPDRDGDYFLRREDGSDFTAAQYGHASETFIARPDGTEWKPGYNSPHLTVRNRKAPSAPRQFAIGDRVDIVGYSEVRYPATVKALSANVVMVLADADALTGLMTSFFRETGETTGPTKLLRLDMTRVRTVYYRTFGPKGFGGLHSGTLAAAEALCRTVNGVTQYGVLKFTEEDGKIVNIEVAHVAK